MENLFFEYMNRRLGGMLPKPEHSNEPGPVITISRQTGCGASKIAFSLCQKLNEKNRGGKNATQWNYISKEIIQQSAGELNIDPDTLKLITTDRNRGMMDQIVEAMSSHAHKSDQKIIKTIQNVIRRFAVNGNCVIVGRGGAGQCDGIKRSLHIRLEAPTEWRIEATMGNFGFSREFATEYIHKHDEEREHVVNKFYGNKHGNMVYDLVINRSRFTEDEIVEAIFRLSAIKGVV